MTKRDIEVMLTRALENYSEKCEGIVEAVVLALKEERERRPGQSRPISSEEARRFADLAITPPTTDPRDRA